jgi:phospholipase C
LSGATATAGGKIKHIVYIVQEGRSFDNLFQGYPGADTV